MRSLLHLWRPRFWAALSLLSLFALSLPCAAQYPGGGYPGGGSGGGYPGSGGGSGGSGGGYPGGGGSGGGYPGGGSWQTLPCDVTGTLLPSPAYDGDGFLPLTGTETGTASNTYPQVMRDAARNNPAQYGWYLDFSPCDETQFPYTPGPMPAIIYSGFQQHGVGLLDSATSSSAGGNYADCGYGNVTGTYCVPDANGNMVSGPINGGISTGITGTLTAYFKWFYVDGSNQPLIPPLGDTGPPAQMTLLLHTRVWAGNRVDYGTSQQTSRLTATASASDGLGDSVTPPTPVVTLAQPSASNSQALDTPFLLQPTPGSNGVAAVSLTGTTSTSINDPIPFGAYGPYPGYPGTSYYQTTNGKPLAMANAAVTGRTQAVAVLQARSTLDSANWDLSKPLFFSGTTCTTTGGLTLPASFTIPHAQLSVNGLVIQEYDDTAAAPLSTDPRIVYSTGTSQSWVALTTIFDATIYPEGYLLPLKMRVWSSRGGPFEVNLSAPVHLPRLTPYVIWTPDYTAAPVGGQLPQALAPTGTAMGGNSTLRVRVAYPPTVSGTLTELRLHFHADPDATRDIVFPNVPLRLATVQNQAQAPYAAWAALCQDPDPALTLSPPCAYAEVPWNSSAGLRNGVYDLTSAVTVTGSDGVTRTWTSPAFAVDREDLLITATAPVNPAPLLWDPSANGGSPAPLPLSATFHAAYKATGTATVQVYTSDQTLVRTLTKPVLTTDGTTDAGTPLTWDGNGEPVNGQPGSQQPKGVYLFQWTLSDSLGLTDSDKSPWLSVTQTESDLTGDYNPATDQSTTKDSCVLTDNFSPLTAVVTANVCVYGADLSQIVAPTLLSPLMPNAPGQSPPVRAAATFLLVTQGEEIHLFSAQDNHASVDRGGRNLWALQHNKGVNRSCAVAFTQASTNIADKFFTDRSDFLSAIQAMQYRAIYLGTDSSGNLLNRFGYYSSQPGPSALTADVMRRALEHQTLGGVKILKVAMSAGDGSADGQWIEMHLNAAIVSVLDLVASQAYHRSKPHIAGVAQYHQDWQDTTINALELDTIAPKGATGFVSVKCFL